MTGDQLARRVNFEEVAASAILGLIKILSAEGEPGILRPVVDDIDCLDRAISSYMVAKAVGKDQALVAEAAAHVGTCLSLVLRAGFVNTIAPSSER
jgi:hypothetical protein